MKRKIHQLEELVKTLIRDQDPAHCSPDERGPASARTDGRPGSRFHSTAVLEHVSRPDGTPPTLDGGGEEQGHLIGSFGRFRLGDGESSYVGADHWSAILDHITELKDFFEGEDEENPHMGRMPSCSGPMLLMNASRPKDKADVLSSIPSRSATDRLVSRYFNTNGGAAGETRALMVHPG